MGDERVRYDPLKDQTFMVDRKVLEMQRFTDTFVVKPANLMIERFDDVIKEEIKFRVEAMVATDHIAADHEVVNTHHEWPATTWQMFKSRNGHRWWLNWLVKRKPVRYETTTETGVVLINRYLAYPEATIQSHRMGKPFIFEDVKQIEL